MANIGTPTTPTQAQTTGPVIDFEAIKAQAQKLSPEERKKKLEQFRARQLFQQKKQQAKGSQALYNKKRNEEFKLLKQMAIEDGTWDEIESKAKAEADSKLDLWLDEENEKAGEVAAAAE